jgi:hypothetical protein
MIAVDNVLIMYSPPLYGIHFRHPSIHAVKGFVLVDFPILHNMNTFKKL